MIMMSFLIFMMGASIGSFLPVYSYRKKNGIPIDVNSRSICDHCQTPLTVLSLIPVFGYLFIGGKSQCCKKPIPARYPLLESGLGLTAMALFHIII